MVNGEFICNNNTFNKCPLASDIEVYQEAYRHKYMRTTRKSLGTRYILCALPVIDSDVQSSSNSYSKYFITLNRDDDNT